MNPLKVNNIRSKFSLPDKEGEKINLVDYQGLCTDLFLPQGDGARLNRASLGAVG